MVEEEFLDDKLLTEVEERLEELEYEYGNDTDIDEIRINEKLRDEFKDPKYKKILIELGINEADIGLTEITNTTSSNLLTKDDKNINALVKVLLDTSEHIERLDKRLRGFEEDVNKTWKRRLLIFIPAIERIKIISFLEGIWLPQNIISNKKLTMRDFESRMNKQLQDIRIRLENYPDKIIKFGTIKYIIGILLNEVAVVINAIESGNLGKIATDMIIGSYNERAEPQKDFSKEDLMRALKN